MPERRSQTWSLWVVSFLLAFFAWLYIRFGGMLISPHAGEVRVTVPITLTGMRADLKAHVDPVEANVVLVGDTRADADVHAVVHIAVPAPGVYHLPLQIESTSDVLSVAPANVIVTIDKEG